MLERVYFWVQKRKNLKGGERGNMPIQTVSYLAAFVAGVVSFFSPCILPMIPVYIMFMTGASLEEEVAGNRKKAFIRTLFFVLGFTILFMIMGSTVTFIGAIFQQNRDMLSKISGLLIIFFGVILMGGFKIPFPNISIRMPKAVSGNLSAMLMGMAFVVAWTPCFGGVLAGILALAGTSQTWLQGMILLGVYSAGMGIPFLLTALFINEFSRLLQKMEKAVPIMLKLFGILMIVFGGLIFFNKLTVLMKVFN